MFIRLLFVALAALNIATAAWLLLGPDPTLVRSASEPGIPELRLLTELPHPSASVSSAPRAGASD